MGSNIRRRVTRVGPISAGQFLSIFLVFIGAAFVAVGLRKKEYERALREDWPLEFGRGITFK